MDKRLAECQRVIGYHFANPNQLEIALTHSSLRSPDRECNERLEFLGDSVLGLVITEELYRLLPDQAEGELTRIKSAVVSRGALYRTSTKLGLARFAEFARGVGRRNELPVSVIANLVESVIGAIYLDAGFFPAREFVLRHMGDELDDVLNDRGAKNYKSLLQHDAQQAQGATPTYRVVDAEGPHHRKQFTVAAVIQGKEWGRGSGATKKEAEQEAAKKALAAWQRRGRGRRRRGGRKPAAEASAAAGRGGRRARPEPEATPTRGRRRGRGRGGEAEPAAEAPRRRGRGARGEARKPEDHAKVRKDPAPVVGDFAAGLDEPLPNRERPRATPAPEADAPAKSPRRRRKKAADKAPETEPAGAPEAPNGHLDGPLERPARDEDEAPARPRRTRKRKPAAAAPATDAPTADETAEKPARRPRRTRKAAGEPAAKPAAKPAEAPAAPDAPAEAGGFGAGIVDDGARKPRTKKAPRKKKTGGTPTRKVKAKKKAPKTEAPPPPGEDGFGAGLQ